MGMSEKIRILLIKKDNMSVTKLASLINTSAQNLNSKLKRDNFTEKDLKEIAKALKCEYNAEFIIPETGERI